MAEWYEALDAGGQEQVTAKGWNKPAADVIGDLFKSYSGAQSLIGSDPAAVVKLPKDASDPSYSGIYDRVVGMALPKSADEYKFDGINFKDGSGFADTDAAFIRDTSVKHKLTPAQSRGLAADLAAYMDASVDADTSANATAKAANDTALRTAWAADYDRHAAGAASVLDALKAKGINVTLDGLDPTAHVAQMNALFQLSQELREMPLLQGSSAGNPAQGGSMTREQATARYEQVRTDTAWIAKALGEPASNEAKELHNLQAYMSGVTPEEFTMFKAGGRINR